MTRGSTFHSAGRCYFEIRKWKCAWPIQRTGRWPVWQEDNEMGTECKWRHEQVIKDARTVASGTECDFTSLLWDATGGI